MLHVNIHVVILPIDLKQVTSQIRCVKIFLYNVLKSIFEGSSEISDGIKNPSLKNMYEIFLSHEKIYEKSEL